MYYLFLLLSLILITLILWFAPTLIVIILTGLYLYGAYLNENLHSIVFSLFALFMLFPSMFIKHTNNKQFSMKESLLIIIGLFFVNSIIASFFGLYAMGIAWFYLYCSGIVSYRILRK